MKLKALSLSLATTALVALAAPILAEDKTGSNVNPEATATPGAAATLVMAYELYDLGKAQGDALTVLTAAKLAASVAPKEGVEPAALSPDAVTLSEDDSQSTFRRKAAPATPAAPAPVMNEGERPISKVTLQSATGEDDGSLSAPATVDEMFALATELAGDDETLKGLIADAQAETTRGAVGGAQQWISRLSSGQVDVYEIAFYGNSYAELAILGDGDANLDMVITDENGNVICYDTSASDQIYCDWVPAWNGYFYVAVENTGKVRNTYYLITN